MIPEIFKAWVREYVDQKLANVLRYSKVKQSSADEEHDRVEGWAVATNEPPGSDSRGYYTEQAVRVAPWGLRSRAPANVPALWLKVHGGATQPVVVGHHSLDYGPTDHEAGEVELYCSTSDTRIKMDVNGKITLTAGNASVSITKDGAIAVVGGAATNITLNTSGGGEVVVNAGPNKVSRVGDKSKISTLGALKTWMGQVEAYINTAVPLTVTPLVAAFESDPGIELFEGADYFKA